MLTQGQFAAFLNADANDRAGLLEELTGTEIYGLISERIYQHWKNSDDKLKQLKAKAEGVILLSEKEITDLNTQQAKLQEQQQQIQAEIKAWGEHLEWWKDMEKVQISLSEAQESVSSATKAKTDHQADLDQLERAIPAETLRFEYKELQRVKGDQEKTEQALNIRQDTVAQLVKDKTSADNALNDAQNTHTQYRNVHQSLECVIAWHLII